MATTTIMPPAIEQTDPPAAPPICRHWVRTGGKCLYQNSCKFRHPPEALIVVPPPEPSQPTASSSSLDPTLKSSNNQRTRTRPNRTNDNRASIFRRFLLDTYTETRLKSTTNNGSGSGSGGPLEISAGIHANLSFELLNLNGVSCTVIEPRGPLRFDKSRRKLRKGIYHRTEFLQRYNSIGHDEVLLRSSRSNALPRRSSDAKEDCNDDDDDDDGKGNDADTMVGTSPRHWRLFFGKWMLPPSSDGENSDSETDALQFDDQLARSVRRAAALEEGAAKLGGHEKDFCCCACDCCCGCHNDGIDTDEGGGDDNDNGSSNDDAEDEDEGGGDKNANDDANGSNSNRGEISTLAAVEAASSPEASPEESENEHQIPPTRTEITSTLRNATILLALHPDQPTGDIVDVALHLNKPFAVVPCCVFPNLFPDRTTLLQQPDGTPDGERVQVRTYEQLLDWIEAKDGRIRRKDLGFGGRSVALYFDPTFSPGKEGRGRRE